MANRQSFTAFVAATAVLCLGFSLWLCFHAGCVGDTKGGSYGDPVRAIELERDAFVSLVVGVLGIAVVIASLDSLGRSARVAYSLGFIVLGFPVFWFLGLDLEDRGVHACFRSNSRLQRPAAAGALTAPARGARASNAAAAESPSRWASQQVGE